LAKIAEVSAFLKDIESGRLPVISGMDFWQNPKLFKGLKS
jgi:hypothetical protein